MPHTISRLSCAASAAFLMSLAAPAVGLAASSPAPALPSASCKQEATTKAFSKVDGDAADYSVAPGGNFESGAASWTTSSGAKYGSGNESIGVTKGSRSIVIPVAGSVTSPAFCIDQTNPHFRFAYRIDSVGMTGFLAEVLYDTASGQKAVPIYSSQQVSVSLMGAGWQVSPKSPLATVIPLPKNGATAVKIRITGITIGGGNVMTQVMGGGMAAMGSPIANIGVSIDSVMVDPYRRS